MDVYLLARDLNGVPVGRHQFFLIVTGDSPEVFALRRSRKRIVSKNLGGQYGLVLGAQRIAPEEQSTPADFNRLKFVAFEKSDMSAAKEFLYDTPSNLSEQFNYQPPQAKIIKPVSGVSDRELVNSLLSAIDYYVVNERRFNIAYPSPWLGKNSNSWTNSILDVIPADLPDNPRERRRFGNFRGANAGHDVRIDKMYFKGICDPCAIQNPVHR